MFFLFPRVFILEPPRPAAIPSCRKTTRSVFTSCALPEGLETFLLQDLPEAVHHAVVGRLAGPRRHLQAGLDDVGGGHQRGRRDAFNERRALMSSMRTRELLALL